jgi:hypothetical protein
LNTKTLRGSGTSKELVSAKDFFDDLDRFVGDLEKEVPAVQTKKGSKSKAAFTQQFKNESREQFRGKIMQKMVARHYRELPVEERHLVKEKIREEVLAELHSPNVQDRAVRTSNVAELGFAKDPEQVEMDRFVKQMERENKKDLRFVSFTVDPEFDTPEVLSKYADMFGADKKRWYFLSGPKEKVYQLIQEGFQLAVGPDEKDPIQVVHSLSFVLIGKKGEVLGHFNTNEPDMLTNLREQLKELP